MKKAYKIIKKIINLIESLFLVKDYIIFKKNKNNRFITKISNFYPQIRDKTKTTNFDAHYIYHPAWAARIIEKIKPEKHIDISSTLNFSTMLSAFVPVEFYDYRPAKIKLSNLESEEANLLNLPFQNNSIKSLSCMHTIEHIGLGRYGDPIDPDGDIKAIKELIRVLAQDGNLLVVVPVGQPKICFNAHRIYSYNQIIEYFKELKLVEFSLVPDNGNEIGIINNASKEESDSQEYGCGCFWFKK